MEQLEAPDRAGAVLLDMGLTERSAQNLKIFMDSKGFRASQVTFEVDTTSRRKRARVTYRTRQGEPYRIDSVSYEFRDKFLEQIILPDTANTLLRKGGIFDITVLDRERERIAAYLKERGYYNFTVNNIEYVADTLGGGHKVGARTGCPSRTLRDMTSAAFRSWTTTWSTVSTRSTSSPITTLR